MAVKHLEPALRAMIGEQGVSTLLLVGDMPEVAWEAVVRTATADAKSPPVVTRLAANRSDTVSDLGIHDLVAVGETLEHLPRRDGERLLAGLRDIYARRVILRLAVTGDWKHQDIMALGFKQLITLDNGAQRVTFYGFDLDTYKTTPDWLNPRYWANPELFGHHRW